MVNTLLHQGKMVKEGWMNTFKVVEGQTGADNLLFTGCRLVKVLLAIVEARGGCGWRGAMVAVTDGGLLDAGLGRTRTGYQRVGTAPHGLLTVAGQADV